MWGWVLRCSADAPAVRACVGTGVAGLGELPLGIAARLTHGIDIVALVVAVGLASWPMAAALAVAGCAWGIARAMPGE